MCDSQELYRYFSVRRPIDLRTYPKPKGNELLGFENFRKKEYISGENLSAWGYLDYAEPLSAKDILDYELYSSVKNF